MTSENTHLQLYLAKLTYVYEKSHKRVVKVTSETTLWVHIATLKVYILLSLEGPKTDAFVVNTCVLSVAAGSLGRETRAEDPSLKSIFRLAKWPPGRK